MPTYSIQAPNGKTYDIPGPAGATDEEVQAAVLQQYPEAAEVPSRPAAEHASDASKYLPGFLKEKAADFATGAANAVDMPLDLLAMATKPWRDKRGAEAPFRPGETLQNAVGLPDPKTDYVPGSPESMLKAILRTGGGASVGPGGVVLKGSQAVLGGLGGEGTAAWLGEKGRWIGELAGLVTPAMLQARTPNAVKAYQSLLKEHGEEGIRDMGYAQDAAEKALGARGPISQAAPHEGSAFEAYAARAIQDSPYGRGKMNDQLDAGVNRILGTVDEASALPLNSGAAVRVRDTWKDAVREPDKWRTQVTGPLYDAAGKKDVSTSLVAKIIDKLIQTRDDMRFLPESVEGKVFTGLANKLEKVNERAAVNMTDPNALAIWKLFAVEGRKAQRVLSGAKEGDKATAVARIEAKETAGNILKKAVPEIEAADKAFVRASGPSAKMDEMGMKDISKGVEKSPDLKTYATLLDQTPEKIQYAAKQLAFQDPEAFGVIVKKSLNDAAEAAIGTGQTSQNATSNFVKSIAGTATKRENLLTAVRENAKMKGGDPVKAGADASELLNALEMAGRSRGAAGTVDVQAVKAAEAANIGSTIARAPSVLFHGRNVISETLDKMVSGNVNKKFVEALFAPDAAARLAEIVRTSPTGNKGKALLSGMAAMSGNGNFREQPETAGR